MKGDSNDGMTADDKVLINLSTGLEDAERVTVALLVATAAVSAGKQVAIWLTKEAVRLAQPGFAEAVACDGCPPLGDRDRASSVHDAPPGKDLASVRACRPQKIDLQVDGRERRPGWQ